MSSLLTTATPWTDSASTTKKRVPSMKLPKITNELSSSTPFVENYDVNLNSYQMLQESNPIYNSVPSSNTTPTPPTANTHNNYGFFNNDGGNNEKNKKINQLLDKSNQEDDGSGIVNYSQNANELGAITHFPEYNEVKLQEYKNEPAQPMWKMKLENTWKSTPPPTTSQPQPSPHGSFSSPEDSTTTMYKYAYDLPVSYERKEISENTFEETILYKLQYLTHLTEQMNLDKTNNITEELILYVMVGIFMIYIVDSFTRIHS